MKCDICLEAEAGFLLGNLRTGDQVAFCGPDLARFGLDTAQAVLPPEEILAKLGIPAEGFKNGEAPADAEPPKSKPKGKAKAKPEPGPQPPQGEPQVAASPADE